MREDAIRYAPYGQGYGTTDPEQMTLEEFLLGNPPEPAAKEPVPPVGATQGQ